MTEELKTLKDLQSWYDAGYQHPDALSKSELRLEAIKWIKEAQEKGYYELEGIRMHGLFVTKWIMHFFNIKEEEIK